MERANVLLINLAKFAKLGQNLNNSLVTLQPGQGSNFSVQAQQQQNETKANLNLSLRGNLIKRETIGLDFDSKCVETTSFN